jgi:glutamine---fructose-6-phosphate transaminase (isomerizing)
MCGIVGAIADRDVSRVILTSLKKLEYRGYDSSGIAVFNQKNGLECLRATGKITNLEKKIATAPLSGKIGIAHTRWATHGKPTENNAHPHISNNMIVLVHNGIIENHETLRKEILAWGYKLQSETDTEIIAHLIHKKYLETKNFLFAVQHTVKKLTGVFSLLIMNTSEPECLIAVHFGCPVVIGFGKKESFVASDIFALLDVAKKFCYLNEGEFAEIKKDQAFFYDCNLKPINKTISTTNVAKQNYSLGNWDHYMQKEIFEEPHAVVETLEGRLGETVFAESFGLEAKNIFPKIKNIQIVACGTSWHAGLCGKYWLENLANLPTQVDIASEMRYKKVLVPENTLLITISQSGETADTLAALRMLKKQPFLANLCISNVAESSLVRESQLVFLTRAGIEIGVASTKAYVTQLIALLLLALVLAKCQNINTKLNNELIKDLKQIPNLIEQSLTLEKEIKKFAAKIVKHKNAFYLGRGIGYPTALEGALKMKELSYLHAEAYPAGELKHGPLALIDKGVPVIAVMPNDELQEKVKANLSEVAARDGKLFVIADETISFSKKNNFFVLKCPAVCKELFPLVGAIPLQLLAYHVALLRGNDVDHPRNLAKSVTVE